MDYHLDPIRLGEIPEPFIASIAEIINNRTVAIVRCRQYKNGKQEALHVGSGSLISFHEIYGILTARHVVEKFEGGPCHIGLEIGQTPHAFLFDKELSEIIAFGQNGAEDEKGPDLAFIRIPDADVGTVKASTMSFHSIERDLAIREKVSMIGNSGIWFICGAPEEKVMIEGPWANFETVHIFQHYTLPGIVDLPFEEKGFDYVEMIINYDAYEHAPSTFKGMSGGGLWQAAIEKDRNGGLKLQSLHLGGVIYYQSGLLDGKRRLRCHFRQSIHKNILEGLSTV